MPKRPLAGLRGASWKTERLPDGMQTHVMSVETEDGALCTGVLYSLGGEKTVVSAMHPREFLATHYLVPEILKGGAAVWVQAPRSAGNDLRLEHETALYDVAAGVRYLRAEGFENVVLLGNSGGAGLFAFYAQQSGKAPEARLSKGATGRPLKFAMADFPEADGLVFVAPHPGQGKLLMSCIDPSVTDEGDAFSMDPALSMFNFENGFKLPPGSSTFAPEFLEAYRAAQVERVRRIDAVARDMVAEKLAARKAFKATMDLSALSKSAHSPLIEVWRTDADPRCYDLSLDPSDRNVGSLWGANPAISNYGPVGFARLCTPESWLSTWSGLSSNASLEACLPDATAPTLFVIYTGDNSVFPSDVARIVNASAATDKQRVDIKGNHHGLPVSDGDDDGQLAAGAAIRSWLADRFPMEALV